MSGIPLRLIEPPGDDAPQAEWLVPGNMWRDHECWAVVLPSRTIWYSGLPSMSGAYWTVSGAAPDLTVTPSIDDQDPAGPWHGWITDGELRPA